MNKTLSHVAVEKQRKSPVEYMSPKVVAVAYGIGRSRELFITKCKSQFKLGFTKVVVTRAGRLRDWSQGSIEVFFKTFSR